MGGETHIEPESDWCSLERGEDKSMGAGSG